MPNRLTAIVLLLLPLTAACGGPPEAKQPDDPVPTETADGVIHIQEGSKPFIAVEVVANGKGHAAISAPARVEFRDSAISQIGSPLGGRVVSVNVQVGQRVHEGDALVTLDCPDAAAVRSSLESTTASLREAQATLDRQEQMIEQGVGIERERMAAETKVHELEADRQRLQNHLRFLGTGDGNAVVLRAPMAGTVISRKATVGMAVQQDSEPIVEVGDPDATWIVADVFERDLAAVRAAARVHVKLDALPEDLDGHVLSIGSVVSAGLRTAPVRIAIETRGLSLRPGMFGRASIAAPEDGLSLPADAILIRGGKDPVVYVQTDPLTFVRRPVVVSQNGEDGRVQVVSGLAPGDKVVVKGALLLDGSADQLL